MSNNYRRTYAEINLSNILHNYLYVRDLIYPRTVIPVVKANAYGHGSIEVTSYLINHGIDHFAVSLLEEGLELRDNFPDINILIMGVIHHNDLFIASEKNITVTISNLEQVHILKSIEFPLKVHLKVDTGMNRLGFKTDDDILYAINELKTKEYVYLEGVYTHFSTADSDYEYYLKQKNRFDEILEMIDYKFDMIHASNSSSSIKYENGFDYTTHTRLGISLYGLTLDQNMDFLKPAFKLITKISEIKLLRKGEKVGYGASYEAKENELIGILPIGYADGFIRKNQGGDVEIKGKRYPIIGRICMDQMFIKIDSSISKEDDVVLMGGLITIDEVANRLDTINYEVICQITYRVPRIYREE